LEEALIKLQTAAEAISESQVQTGGIALQILNALTNFVNESSKAVGLQGDGMGVAPLSGEDLSDEGKILSKLDEIAAKLDAMRESVETDDVAIRSWFEAVE
jgi:hypothetical protein